MDDDDDGNDDVDDNAAAIVDIRDDDTMMMAHCGTQAKQAVSWQFHRHASQQTNHPAAMRETRLSLS